MALLSELVRIVAAVEGLEEVSVGIFARHAREAGFITQGGRGKSAAKMTITDAANLLIAVNGCSLAKDVSESLPKIRALPLTSESADSAQEFGFEKLRFGESFERIIVMMQQKDRTIFPGETFIRFFRPEMQVEVKCYFAIEGRKGQETLKYRQEMSELRWPEPDRSDETVISHVTLRSVAKAISN